MDERRPDGFRFGFDVIMTGLFLYQYLNDQISNNQYQFFLLAILLVRLAYFLTVGSNLIALLLFLRNLGLTPAKLMYLYCLGFLIPFLWALLIWFLLVWFLLLDIWYL